MTRINLYRNPPIRNTACGTASKANSVGANVNRNFEKTGALLFGAVLIVCSFAVGCSNDKPKSMNAANSASAVQTPAPSTLATSIPPAPQPVEQKPAVKKVVRKRPANVTYVDQTSGVSFDYPRRYAIEGGTAAADLVDSNPLPTNFVAPGGTVLVAVELPETGYANTDFSSAFFGISLNKSLSLEDCKKFAVQQADASTKLSSAEASASAPSVSKDSTATQAAPQQVTTENAAPVQATADATKAETANSSEQKSSAQTDASNTETAAPSIPAAPKIMLREMDVQKTEAVTGEGNRQSDSKFLHVYQNNACYEFALNVTTTASQSDGEMKHIDRDKVFAQLEKILATVKINPAASEKETEKEAATAPAPVPAQ